MSLLLACLCLTNNHVLGYLPSRSRQHPIQQSASLLFAKIKKLQDAFDLSVIEAFELELEQQDTMEDDHDDDDDDEQIIAMQFNDDSSPSMLTWQVPPEYHNTRIDAALAACLVNESRSACGSLVTEGCVQDGVTHEVLNKKSYKVQEGQTLRINLSQRDAKVPTDILVPENIPLDILYEDEHMIVLNKAAGMVVHPAAGNWRGTVVNALAYYLPTSPYGSGEFIANGSMTAKNSNNNEDGEPVLFRPGIVHRLDKGTTGVLVVAKNSHALTSLSEAFANRQVQKHILPLPWGIRENKLPLISPSHVIPFTVSECVSFPILINEIVVVWHPKIVYYNNHYLPVGEHFRLLTHWPLMDN